MILPSANPLSSQHLIMNTDNSQAACSKDYAA